MSKRKADLHSRRPFLLFVAAIVTLTVATCSQGARETAVLDTHGPPAVSLSTAAWNDAVQAYLERDSLRVHVHPATGALVMNHAGLRAVFDGDGVALVSDRVGAGEVERIVSAPGGDETWGVRYRLVALATDASETSLGPGTKSHGGAKVTIDRGGTVTEAYENLPEGLEQRFVVHAAESTDFILLGALEGSLEARLVNGELSVVRNGEEVLHATAPRAFDADGREIEARFVLGVDRLDIEVRGASAFPVLIDPVWTSSGDDQADTGFAAVSSAGDVNGDGFDDVLVGAPGYDTANMNAGKAYLYLGSGAGFSTSPGWTSSGDDTWEAAYGSVSSAGDVDGDGFDDVIVGASEYNSGPGKAFVYLGSAAGLSAAAAWTSSGDVQFAAGYGGSVSSAGDVNGDGFDDVIVGAAGFDPTVGPCLPPACWGKAYLYLGSAAGLSTVPAWTSSGDSQPGALFGHVASAGDVNGDGFDDVLVGARWYDTTNVGAGKAYLYLGSGAGLSTFPAWTSSGDDQADAWYGYVSSAGDVDGDGNGDVIVGARRYGTVNLGAGKAYLYFGSAAGLSANPAWTSSGDDQAGASYGSVASAGDVNADGFDDVLVGASSYDTANMDAGKAYLYLGSATGLSTTLGWYSSGDDQADARYGGVVSSAGDVNGDGFDDVLVGASTYDTSNVNAGKAYLYHGASTPLGYCMLLSDGALCDDGDPCTMNDVCSAGTCTATPYSCDDLDPCTADICDGDGTCSNPAIGTPVWEMVMPATSPSPRHGHKMANDPMRGVTVLFGGLSSAGILADTWEHDGTTWTDVTPAVSPASRDSPAIAYDSTRGVTVLFGGGGLPAPPPGPVPFDDTWEWDGSTWTEVTPAASPSGRAALAAAYDEARGVTVLFGGWNNSAGYLADTWEYDGTTWTEVTPAVSPPARGWHAMVYDGARGVTTLFGGASGLTLNLNDTWEWNGSSWSEMLPASSPPGRLSHAMAHDSARGVTVLFGGYSSITSTYFGDTWEWNGSAWTSMAPATSPSARNVPSMVFDSARGVAVLFGGAVNPGGIYFGDTWEYHLDCRLPDGEVCTSDAECLSDSCTDGFCCDVPACPACQACDASGSCAADPALDGSACDDGDGCTSGDTCAAGACAGAPYTCDDGNGCTDDVCNGDGSCSTVNNAAPCDDGDACTSGDTCGGGLCTPGAPVSCDDGNACTIDACDLVAGCQSAPVTDGTLCADGDLCNGDETCQTGTCTAGAPLDCDDGDPCTTDSCDPASGCQNVGSCPGTDAGAPGGDSGANDAGSPSTDAGGEGTDSGMVSVSGGGLFSCRLAPGPSEASLPGYLVLLAGFALLAVRRRRP